MPQREFEITITPQGEVRMHIHGYKGKGCLAALKFVEQMVGPVKSQQETSEFYEPEEEVHFRIDQRQ